MGYIWAMDDLVKAALKKWPNVPACYGWLGLDSRGQWWMRDEHAQRCGAFDSGSTGSKGSLLRHDKLIEFIHRNYESEPEGHLQGAWYFQNGPQKVYVELESTPLIMRVGAHTDKLSVRTHTDISTTVLACLLDELGHLYLDTDHGIGLVHSQDMACAADAIEAGLWKPQEVSRTQLQARFGFVKSPVSLHSPRQAPPQTRS